MKKFNTTIVVRYAETDRMGIAHHSCYPIWFEAARTEFIKDMGMTYTEFESMGLYLPLSELHVKYRACAYYEDELTVITRIERVTCARIVFAYEVFREKDQTVVAEGTTVHACTDPKINIINISKTHPDIYRLLSSGR